MLINLVVKVEVVAGDFVENVGCSEYGLKRTVVATGGYQACSVLQSVCRYREVVTASCEDIGGVIGGVEKA